MEYLQGKHFSVTDSKNVNTVIYEINKTEKAYYQYMAQKAAEIKRRNEQKPIRSRFLYLRKLIQGDVSSKAKQSSQAVAKGTQVFQNFTERQDNNYTDKIMDKLKSDLKEFQENQNC